MRLAQDFRAIHDGDSAAIQQAKQVCALIDQNLNGEDEWQQVPVEIKLLDLANQDRSLARQYAAWIEPPTIADAVRRAAKPTLAACAVAGAAALAYQQWPWATQFNPFVRVSVTDSVPRAEHSPLMSKETAPTLLPAPPAEPYRDRSAKIKQSKWWSSDTPTPPGDAEKAWLTETRALSAKGDMAARLNLGLVELADLVPGATKRGAVQTLTSGLELVSADALTGADARVVRDAACNATNVAIFDRDTTLARTLAPAFEHLGALGDHEAALTAGHIHACRVSPTDVERAAQYYQIASAARDAGVRTAAQGALTATRAGTPRCYFPAAQIKKC